MLDESLNHVKRQSSPHGIKAIHREPSRSAKLRPKISVKQYVRENQIAACSASLDDFAQLQHLTFAMRLATLELRFNTATATKRLISLYSVNEM